jgi:hypothetical protein
MIFGNFNIDPSIQTKKSQQAYFTRLDNWLELCMQFPLGMKHIRHLGTHSYNITKNLFQTASVKGRVSCDQLTTSYNI